MSVDHVARIRSALANTSPPRLAAGDALVSLNALEAQAEFWERRYKELRERWNAAVLNPDAMRRDRDLYLSKTVELKAENQRLKDEAKDMVLAAAYHEMRVLRDAAVAEIQRLREVEKAAREFLAAKDVVTKPGPDGVLRPDFTKQQEARKVLDAALAAVVEE